MMKNILYSLLILGMIAFSSGCEKFLDVNTNPNGPEKATAYLYLAPMQNQLVLGLQWDSRYLGFYTQNWASYSANYLYDKQGIPGYTTDAGGELWRSIYWKMGLNLSEMIKLSEEEERWDLAGIGYALRAYGWQLLTDYHGEVILKEAFQPGLLTFKYDTQQDVYQEVVVLCNKAIELLNRSDGKVSATFAGKGDLIYAGDRIKWKKFAYAILAINASRLSNKSSLYNPNDVIRYVDSSFTSNSDNAYLKFAGTVNDDTNFLGPLRNNFLVGRTSKFMASLMDGSIFGVADPRRRIMLPPSLNIINSVPGAQYIGVTPELGYTSIAANDRPYNCYGLNSVANNPVGTVGMYVFRNNSSFPILTYSQLQFIKAEAAFRAGNKTTAIAAYTNGVSSAVDFANLYAGSVSFGTIAVISAAEKTAYLGDVNIIPTDENLLTMAQIMSQKYIHQWSWACLETWCDLRRFHYTDTYGTEATQVFPGFALPAFAPENNGKSIQRMRPRYNSEYVWNLTSLTAIGATATDYHTVPVWFTVPE
jgi:hypothetical protein